VEHVGPIARRVVDQPVSPAATRRPVQ